MAATTILDNRTIRANQKAKEGRMRRNGRGSHSGSDLGHDWEVENFTKVRLSWWKRVINQMKAMVKL